MRWLPIVALFGLVCRAPVNQDGGQLRLLGSSEPLYQDLSAAVVAWSRALLSSDEAALARFTLPEWREILHAELKDKSSTAYRTYLGPERSFARLLRQEHKVVLFERTPMANAAGYATVCFARKGRVPGHWPRTRGTLFELVRWPDLYCIDWFRVDSPWLVDDGLADDVSQ